MAMKQLLSGVPILISVPSKERYKRYQLRRKKEAEIRRKNPKPLEVGNKVYRYDRKPRKDGTYTIASRVGIITERKGEVTVVQWPDKVHRESGLMTKPSREKAEKTVDLKRIYSLLHLSQISKGQEEY